MPKRESTFGVNGLLVHCPNLKCNYTWAYTGRFNFYATCPSCRKNVKITENKIKSELQSAKVGRQNQTAAESSAIARGLISG